MNFEQNDEDVLLDEVPVFKMVDLENWVNGAYSSNLWENVWSHNTSPRCDGDPAYDHFVDKQVTTAKEWLEDEANFQMCCKEYYEKVCAS